MSFAREVKEEVISHEFTLNQSLMFLSGFIKYNGELIYTNKGLSLKLTSFSNTIIRKIYSLLKVFFHGEIHISIIQTQIITKKKIYELLLVDDVQTFLKKHNIYDFNKNDKILEVQVNDDDNKSLIRAYISGIFVAVGSVNSPETSNYHLEFQFKDLKSAEYICKILNKFQFNFKIITKKNKFICYLKKSLYVSDFIKFVDASKAVMKFENKRISRDFSNSLNRVMNIEIYNQQKTYTTGSKQIDQIEFIKHNDIFNKLSKKAQKLANIRINNPDASYSDLEILMNEAGISITKSGISNLFKIITKTAKENGG